jgi:hypothetical protein
MKIYIVYGYNLDEDPKNAYYVFMSEFDEVLPDSKEEIGYSDEEIYFYGVDEKFLDSAIQNKEPIGDFIPLSWGLHGTALNLEATSFQNK